MQKSTIISISVIVVGAVIIILGGVVGWIIVPDFIDKTVKKEAQLKNGTEIYDKWKDIPVPIFLKCYFFNVTNSEDYDSGRDGNWSAKPIVKEIGPYVYKETRVKYNIASHEDTDTVSYRQNISFHFVPELSIGPDTDLVNIINAPLISVATALTAIPRKDLPLPHGSIMEFLMGPLSGETFIKKDVTVRDVVFGWRLNAIYDLFVEVAERFYDITFPPELQDGKFGAYLNRNATNWEGLWEVFSGVKDTSKIGMLHKINRRTHHEKQVWKGECNRFNGTDGTMFPPFVKKDTKLYAYAPEGCRSVWMSYEKEIKFEGIPGYRFSIPKEVFTGPNNYPPNDCYCMPIPEPLNGTCDITGGARIFSCKSGAPVFVSKPHFLDGESAIRDLVEGMNPIRDLHDSFLDIQPTLGFPMNGHKRLQVNIETQPLPIGAPWDTIPHAFFPLLWLDEEAFLDEELIDEVKSKLITPLKIVEIGKWTAIGVGCLTFISGILSLTYYMWWKPSHS